MTSAQLSLLTSAGIPLGNPGRSDPRIKAAHKLLTRLAPTECPPL